MAGLHSKFERTPAPTNFLHFDEVFKTIWPNKLILGLSPDLGNQVFTPQNSFTTRKQSLGQGNVFTGVFLSTERGGVPTGGLHVCIQWGLPTKGVCLGVCIERRGWVDLPELEKRAVCMILKCFLVSEKFTDLPS